MSESEKLVQIANVAAAYLRRNPVGIDQIGNVILSVTRALDQAAKEPNGGAVEARASTASETSSPAVPINRSVQRDHLVCLEDGLRVQTLKRHLRAAHNMSPAQYREKWQLPPSYPLTAPAYSERRSKMAKALGLGRKAGSERTGRPRGRPRKSV